jgi:hypothetical protein
LDDDARIKAAQNGQSQLSELVPALPIDAFPDILVVDSDKVGVEGGAFAHNFGSGPFSYLNDWYAK